MALTRRRSSMIDASTLPMLPPARSPERDNLASLTSTRYGQTTSTPGLHRYQPPLPPSNSDPLHYSYHPDTPIGVLQTRAPLTYTNPAAGPLPFNAQENYCEIICEGTNVVPNIEVKVEKGFFLSSDHFWTCYRRNYFAVDISYDLTPWISNARLYLDQRGSKSPRQIQSIAVSLAAAIDSAGGKSVELIQRTPKRDEELQLPMKSKLLAPTLPGKSHDQDSFDSSTQIVGPQLSLQSDSEPSQQYSPTNNISRKYQYAFERIQFKSATANNGRRRAQQQFYCLIVKLWANVQTPQNSEPCWVRVAARSSHRIVVRGRAPSHYQNEGPRNASASQSTGGGGTIGSGSGTSIMMRDGYRGTAYTVDSGPVGSYSASPPSSSSGDPIEGTLHEHVVDDDDLNINDSPDYKYYPARISKTIARVEVKPGSMGENTYSGNRGYPGSSPAENHPHQDTSKERRYVVRQTSSASDSQELRLEAEESVPTRELSPQINEVLYGLVSAEIPKQLPLIPLTEDASYMPKAPGHPSAETHHWMLNPLNAIFQSFRYLFQKLKCSWQPPIPLGHVRISWTCRCGKLLYADFEKKHQTAGLEFAKQAAGPSNERTISSSCSESDMSTTSSKPQDLNSWKSSPEGEILETPPSSASSASDNQLDSIIPDEEKRYLLLCVNSEIHRIDLAHVDLTPKYEYGVPARKDDQSLFQDVKEEYARLRGNRTKNIIIVPKTIQFVKFEIIHRRLSGECVGNFEKDKIPSKDEAKKFGYRFKPCPPDIGRLPIMPHIFMHSFREPSDHTGSLVVDRLPKKVGERLSSQKYPSVGWGIYIIEGYNWKLLRKCVIGALFATFILMLLWSILKKDVQGGAGIGQYAVAVLALALSVYVLEQSSDN